MDGAGATDDTATRRRAELRRWARAHHPDVGGDLPTYLDGVARIERRWAGEPARPCPPLRVVRARWPVRLSRRLRRRWWAHQRSRRSTVL